MSDLAEWLEAQIAEDERRARAAIQDRSWYSRSDDSETEKDDGVWTTGEHAMDEREVTGIGIQIYDEGGHTLEQAVHIATWDPARVLAECEAKRRIIETARLMIDRYAGGMLLDFARETIRIQALPYADRPGYREEWRP